MYCLKETYFKCEDTSRMQAKEWEKIQRDKIILKFIHKTRGMKIVKNSEKGIKQKETLYLIIQLQ